MVHVLPLIALLRLQVLSLLRRRGIFAFVAIVNVLVVGCSALAVLSMGPGEFQLNQLGQWCTSLFIFFIFAVSIATVLCVPPLAGSAVVTEIRRETFESLTLTHLRPYQFVLANMAASSVLEFVLLASLMPVLALTYFGVGVDADAIAKTIAITIVSSLGYAAAGLFASTVCRGPISAVFLAFVLASVLFGAPFLFGAMVVDLLNSSRWGTSGDPIRIGVNFSPLLYGISSAIPDRSWRPAPMPLGAFSMCLLAQSLAAVLFYALTVSLLGKEWDRAANAEETTTPEIRARRWMPQCKYLGFADACNPVYRLDTQLHLPAIMQRPVVFCAATSLGLILLLLLVSMATSTPERIETSVLAVGLAQICFFPMLLPPLLAGLVNKERDENTLDALRMTLLTSHSVAMGKAYVSVRTVLLLIVPVSIAHLGYVIIEYVQLRHDILPPRRFVGFDLTVAIATPIMLCVCMACSATISLAASAVFRSIGASFAAAYAILGWLGMGMFFCVLVPVESMLNGHIERSFYFLSPIVVLVELQSPNADSSPAIYIAWIFNTLLLLGVASATIVLFALRVQALMKADGRSVRRSQLQTMEQIDANA